VASRFPDRGEGLRKAVAEAWLGSVAVGELGDDGGDLGGMGAVGDVGVAF